MKQSKIRTLLMLPVAVIFALWSLPADAQSDGDEDIQQTVARVSYISGDVSYTRGDDPDNWQSAAINVAFTLGDRLYAPAGGRAELEVHGGSVIDLAEGTDLSALNLTEDVKQFSLNSGTASFRIRGSGDGKSFEVDSPNVAVSFARNGLYRVDVDRDGNTTLDVRRGQATVAAGGGEVNVDSGQRIRIEGTDQPRYDVANLPPPDGWDSWVDQRQARARQLQSYQYVNSEVAGLNDLDSYGAWVDVPEYGHVWAPSSVESDWQPYQIGSWVWQDPWGWTWVSTEPWGWAPYHYGRWVVWSSRWYWVPGARDVRVRYSPALVGFVGGGPGWRGSVSASGGYVGWFPLAPADPFVPWWGRRREVDATNVTYVNRTYVTVVNNTTFVSGGGVARSVVRDPVVVRQIVAAPVIRGTLPVMPTPASLRVTQRAPVSRPPASMAIRPVVTRLAPPPAPPLFRAKLDAIRQAGGAPVSSAAASRLSTQAATGTRAVVPIRPAASRSGGIVIAPRGGGAGAPQPQPIRVLPPRPSAPPPPPPQQQLAPPMRASEPPPRPPAPKVTTELGHDAPMPRNAPENQDRRPVRPAPPPPAPERHAVPPPEPAPARVAPPAQSAPPQVQRAPAPPLKKVSKPPEKPKVKPEEKKDNGKDKDKDKDNHSA